MKERLQSICDIINRKYSESVYVHGYDDSFGNYDYLRIMISFSYIWNDKFKEAQIVKDIKDDFR